MIIPNRFNGYDHNGHRHHNWLPIAAAIAAVVGAALQHQGAQRSARAVAAAEAQALRNQQKRQEVINQKTLERAEDYRTDTRQKQQDAIRQELTDTYTDAPLDATAISQQAAGTVGDTSGDYQKAKAESDARVQDGIRTFGRLMADVNSAGRLRQLENFRNADAANLAGVQQALMRGDARLGQYKMEQASHAGDSLTGLGQLSSLAGTIMSMGSMAGLGGAAGSAGTASAGAGSAAGAGSLSDFSGRGMGYLFNSKPF